MKTKSIKRIVSMLAVAAIMAPTMATLPASAQIRDNLDPNKTFVSAFATRQDLTNAAAAYNVELMENGAVLLKNENNGLPMAKGAKVTVIGSAADNVALGGGGSGSQGQPTGWTESSRNLYHALENAGFEVNPAVKAAYEEADENSRSAPGASEDYTYMAASDVTSTGAVEFAGKYYTNKEDGLIKDSMLNGYKDAAIVFIMRSGTEGADSNAINAEGHEDPLDTYFSLEDSEKEMIAYAKKNFDKVIMVINAPSAMELHDVENDDGIDSVLWMGQPGWNGILGISRILNGEVNPSGHTVDIYMADQTKDPTYFNFGNYRQAYNAIGVESNSRNTIPMGHEEGTETTYNTYAIDYAEGIYMGYRYYETVAADLGDDGDAWYQDNVTYSFGHGLSYTTFEHEIKEIKGDLSKADGEVTVTVEVKNTGSVPGKDAVQLYVSKPYTAGGIEKAAIDLVSFAKTDIIAAGESETVSMTIAVKDLASFDYDDKNGNDFCGYELEAGNYVLSVRANSHDVFDSETLTAAAALTWDEDGNPDTPNNIYSQPIDSVWGEFNTLAHAWTESGEDHYLSRQDLVEDGEAADLTEQLTWLIQDDGANNKFVDEAFDAWGHYRNGYAYYDMDDAKTAVVENDYENLWVKEKSDIPADWTQAAGEKDENGNYAIVLSEMKGVALDDPKWVEFMNQLTWEELIASISAGGYKNIEVDSVNKPFVTDQDGPAQIKGNRGRGWAWACEVVIASTWDVEMAYQQGQFCGEESMYTVANGWYGPAMNTHRNPMAGRNFEYFSQDGVQGGMIAAANVKGAVDKGCHVYIKHSFLNDQETSRMNTATFATEQAMREIYAKQFELCVRDGDANGFMTSFNRIGVASSCSYATSIQMYENEWGFDGLSVTDFYSAGNSGWSGWAMARATTIPLGNTSQPIDGEWNAEKNVVVCNNYAAQGETATKYDSYTQWYWVRMTSQRLFYTIVNGNGMGGDLANVVINPGFEAEVGEDIGYQHLVDASTRKQFMEIFGSEGYEIFAVSGLPSGLSYEGDGIVSGTPTAPGTYNVYVSVGGLGTMEYLGCKLNMTVVVGGEVEEEAPVAIGQSKVWTGTAANFKIYAVDLGQDVTVSTLAGNPTNADRGKITAYNVAVAADDVPAGMTFDATTGTLSGNATTAGTYEIPATITYTQVVYQNKQNRLVNYEVEGTVRLQVVEGAMGQIEILDGTWYINGQNTGVPVTGETGAAGVNGMAGVDGIAGADGRGIANVAIVDGALVITYTDGEVVNLGSVIGPQGPAGAAGADGAQGPAGPAGPAGAAAEGCGSVIAGTAVAAMLAAAAAFVLRKKEN